MTKIEINYKNKWLRIKVHPRYDYDISFDNLRKREQWWFDHLCGKVWFNSSEKVEFAKATKELKGNNYGKTKND